MTAGFATGFHWVTSEVVILFLSFDAAHFSLSLIDWVNSDNHGCWNVNALKGPEGHL